jgi:homoserine dehydrogenase
LKVALIGYGNVGRAFARLLAKKQAVFPFRIAAIHTARHGTAYDPKGVPIKPLFGPPAKTISEFLQRSAADVAIEITPLTPESGEPAISHIRAAIGCGMHVITANKGPIAHAYAALRDEAKRAQVEFRFESTVMDGTPVFNNVRNNLPGAEVLGFTGVLNSTSKLVIAAMQRGRSMEEGVREAQALGVAEADATHDLDGWDSAAKTAAIANVLMDAHLEPQHVVRKGLSDLTVERVLQLKRQGKTIALVSRAFLESGELRLQVQPEVLDEGDILAVHGGTSNLLLLHTDLMGTIGTVSVAPGIDQTAYGLFSDLVDIARSL